MTFKVPTVDLVHTIGAAVGMLDTFKLLARGETAYVYC